VSHLVVVDDALGNSPVQHLPVPFLQPLRLGDLLVRWVAMEDVVIPFAGGTGPDVTRCVPGTGRHVVVFIRTEVNRFFLAYLKPCVGLQLKLREIP